MWASLILNFIFIQLLSSNRCLFYIHSLAGGGAYMHDQTKSHPNEIVNDGDEWSMEVDLRSREKEKRTLHWFVRGNQQKGFIKGVPDAVEFGVC